MLTSIPLVCIAGGKGTRHMRTLVYHYAHPGTPTFDEGTGTSRSISLSLKEVQPGDVVGVDLLPGCSPKHGKSSLTRVSNSSGLMLPMMNCMHRDVHDLDRVVTFGKRFQLSTVAWPRGNASAGS
jgi:hypothetical protein